MTREQQLAELEKWLENPGFWPVAISVGLSIALASGLVIFLLFKFLPREEPRDLPAARWTVFDVLAAGSFWFLMQLLVGIVASLFPVAGAAPDPSSETTEQLNVILRFALLLVVNLLTFGFLLLFPMLKYQQGPDVFGLESRRLGAGLWKGFCFYSATVPSLFALALIWTVFLVQCGLPAPLQVAVEQFQDLVDSKNYLGVAVVVGAAAVGAPLLEEILFRGILFRWLQPRLGTLSAVVVSGGLFGAVHMNLVALMPTFVLGMLLAYIYHRTSNLWICIFFHAYFNGVQLAIALIAPS